MGELNRKRVLRCSVVCLGTINAISAPHKVGYSLVTPTTVWRCFSVRFEDFSFRRLYIYSGMIPSIGLKHSAKTAWLCRRQSTWERLKQTTRKPKITALQTEVKKTQQGKHYEHDYSIRPHTYSYTVEENKDAFEKYPLVDVKLLSKQPERPKRVKMLARDFMDDSLYNPNYGYFSKEVEIFTPTRPFDYNAIDNEDDFMFQWTKEYREYNKRPGKEDLDVQGAENRTVSRVSRQLWHTPTELFQPYYGEALARYLLVNYKLSLYPYSDLIIYEMGGGNGTLMTNILDYIRDTQPDVYSRTKYNIVEISTQLADKQMSNLHNRVQGTGHEHKVQIINSSIFDWKTVVPEPCFFIALEVFDNFAHDVIRYDNNSLVPYQGYVVIDEFGDFKEIYNPKLDAWAQKFLSLRDKLDYAPSWELGYHPLAQPLQLRQLKNILWPFRGDLSDPEYIPTRYLEFLYLLKRYFPEHRILASDFTHFSERISGYNSPVVQTVLNKSMIPVSTYMVLQGFFDIMFPTDFDLASDLYKKVCGKEVTTGSHSDFMETWAEVDHTMTRSGDNPLLSFYKNAAFMYS